MTTEANDPSPTQNEIIRFKEVQRLTGGRSRSSIWRDVRGGLFPPPIQLSANAIGWYRHEVLAAIANKPRVAYAPSGKAA